MTLTPEQLADLEAHPPIVPDGVGGVVPMLFDGEGGWVRDPEAPPPLAAPVMELPEPERPPEPPEAVMLPRVVP